LRRKYSSLEPTEEATPEKPAVFSVGENQPIKWGSKVVEEVGFEKIKKQLAMLGELRIVLLDGMCIAGVLAAENGAGSEEKIEAIRQITETCPKIAELDVSRCLFQTWADIVDVCIALPNLKKLRVKYGP
jgi:tubulin-specific chaperone E